MRPRLKPRFASVVAVSAMLGTLLAPSQALAFHHIGVPAPECANPASGGNAGGANPTATAAIKAHNPAQTLPLPPVGTPSQAANTPAEQNCANSP